MVEGAFGVPRPAMCARLERHRDIERDTGRLAASLEDHPRVRARWRADAALVRVPRQTANITGRRLLVAQHRMRRVDYCDRLEVAVRPRMIVRPGNRRRIGIVALVARRVGIFMLRMEEMRLADFTERAD